MITQKLKLALCTGAVLFMASCEKKIEGTASVSRSFVAKTKTTSNRTITIPAGNYHATAAVGNSATKFTLAAGNASYQFRVATPRELATTGVFRDFHFTAAQLKQDFSMTGKATTKNTRGSRVTRSESCVTGSSSQQVCTPGYWTGGDYVCSGGGTSCSGGGERCRRVPDSSDDGYDVVCDDVPRTCHSEPEYCHTTPRYYVDGSCHYETVNDYGSRSVTGYNTTTQTTLEVKIVGSRGENFGKMIFQTQPTSSFTTTSTGSCR